VVKGGKEAAVRMLARLAEVYSQHGDRASACTALTAARGEQAFDAQLRNFCGSH
jgi:hypothetical protein